jgi:hypothetical protein
MMVQPGTTRILRPASSPCVADPFAPPSPSSAAAAAASEPTTWRMASLVVLMPNDDRTQRIGSKTTAQNNSRVGGDGTSSSGRDGAGGDGAEQEGGEEEAEAEASLLGSFDEMLDGDFPLEPTMTVNQVRVRSMYMSLPLAVFLQTSQPLACLSCTCGTACKH